MKIQLISDIHLEFYKGDSKKAIDGFLVPADALVLAGDIHVGRTNVKEILRYVSDKYNFVIYVPGNHEYYAGAELGSFKHIAKDLSLPNNVFVLDDEQMLYNDIHFIGSTLWSDLGKSVGSVYNRCRARISQWPDFKRIKDNSLDAHVERYENSKNFIINAISDIELDGFKKCVITHFMPSIKCVNPKWFINREDIPANYYFASNILEECGSILGDTDVWMFGHTHDKYISKTEDGVQLYCNPVGYPNENGPYQPLIVEL